MKNTDSADVWLVPEVSTTTKQTCWLKKRDNLNEQVPLLIPLTYNSQKRVVGKQNPDTRWHGLIQAAAVETWTCSQTQKSHAKVPFESKGAPKITYFCTNYLTFRMRSHWGVCENAVRRFHTQDGQNSVWNDASHPQPTSYWWRRGSSMVASGCYYVLAI